jgi:hypothetical protein
MDVLLWYSYSSVHVVRSLMNHESPATHARSRSCFKVVQSSRASSAVGMSSPMCVETAGGPHTLRLALSIVFAIMSGTGYLYNTTASTLPLGAAGAAQMDLRRSNAGDATPTSACSCLPYFVESRSVRSGEVNGRSFIHSGQGCTNGRRPWLLPDGADLFSHFCYR